MTDRALVVTIAFGLDLLLGDPRFMWHPVGIMGCLISFLEKALRRLFGIRGPADAVSDADWEKTRDEDVIKKRIAGGILALLVMGLSIGFAVAVLLLLERVDHMLRVIAEGLLAYRMLAVTSLRKESMKVFRALADGEIEDARRAVSMIVGRDTNALDRAGVARAAVETVAESTSDGVVAPLFFLAILGLPGVYGYKAVNTMDSMIGYKNNRYRYFGTVAARLDDLSNLIPSRLAAFLMMLGTFLLKPFMKVLHPADACAVWWTDRYHHKSPNSAQTESVCAGALGLRLAGPASYFGVVCEKPYIGVGRREIEAADIKRANVLMYATAILAVALALTCLLLIP